MRYLTYQPWLKTFGIAYQTLHEKEIFLICVANGLQNIACLEDARQNIFYFKSVGALLSGKPWTLFNKFVYWEFTLSPVISWKMVFSQVF